MRTDTKKICVLAALAALAFVAMLFGRIPVVMFLSYDPKDVIITIGGFLYGPLAAMAVTTVVAYVEMLLISDTGYVGMIMNVVAGCSFACTASFIYKKYRSLSGAVIGLIAAWILTTAVMVLWNYLITPLYMGVPRADVVGMMMRVFVPFNLLKGGLNAAVTMLLYKPVKKALQASRMMPQTKEENKGKFYIGVAIASVFVIITCVLWVLVFREII